MQEVAKHLYMLWMCVERESFSTAGLSVKVKGKTCEEEINVQSAKRSHIGWKGQCWKGGVDGIT